MWEMVAQFFSLAVILVIGLLHVERRLTRLETLLTTHMGGYYHARERRSDPRRLEAGYTDGPSAD